MKLFFKNFNSKSWPTFLIVAIFSLVTIILLSSTLKGGIGNPSADYIFKNLKGASMPFENAPERNRYAQILSVAEYGTTTLPLEVAKTVVPDLGYFNGKYVGLYPPGFLLISLPFYLLGKIWGVAQLFTFSISILFAIISIFLITGIGKKLKIGILPSLTSAFLFIFGTSTWAYTTTIYQHIITSVVLLAIFNLLLSKRTIINAGGIWILAFFAFILDTPNLFFVTPFVLFMIFQKSGIDKVERKIKIIIPKTIIYGFFFCVPLIASWMYYNTITYGIPIKISQQVISVRKFDKFNNPVLPKNNKQNKISTFLSYEKINEGTQALLTSKDRGLVLYSPYIILFLLGIKSLYKKYNNYSSILFITIGTIFAIYSSWGDPWGGWAFGPRYLIPLFALSSIFLAEAIQIYRRNYLFLIVLFISGLYSISMNALGALTTNQVPPYHEATGLHMKYNFLLNIDYIKSNTTGSFIYNSFFKSVINLFQYLLVLIVSAASIFILLLTTLILKRKAN